MSKKAETTEITPAKAQEMAVYEAMSMDAGSGFEEAGLASFAIPFISILQSGSPQCKKSDGAFIPGSEEGMFINSVSNEVISGEEGIHVIPFYFAQRFIAWGLREKGGGFKGEFKPNEAPATERDNDGRDIMASHPDQQLVDTRVHYVLLSTSNGWTPAVLSLSSTQVKKSKQWMSRMRGMQIPNRDGVLVDAPMASHIWHLTTVAEGNDKGTWFGLKVGQAVLNSDMPAYRKAMDLKKQVQEGQATAQYEAPTESKDDF